MLPNGNNKFMHEIMEIPMLPNGNKKFMHEKMEIILKKH